MDILDRAIVQGGGISALAKSIGVSVQRLNHWRKRGMPRTEWTGETDFAKRIERATRKQTRATDLLHESMNGKAA